MTQFIKCDYCTQNNYADALCCQWCGAPMPILIPGEITKVLDVRGHEMQTHSTPLTVMCSTAAAPERLCSDTTTPIEFDWIYRNGKIEEVDK